jgi:hypothetical protein
MDIGVRAWDRQNGESDRWYQRFNSFRLQGPGRSIESTWANEAKCGKAKRPNSRWYKIVKAFDWWKRANDWDQFLSDEVEAKWKSKIMGPFEALALLSDIAHGDQKDLMDLTTSGFVINLMTKNEKGDLVPRPQTKLIKRIRKKVTTYLSKDEKGEDREIIETELELYSAHDALRDIGKYHGIFLDRADLTTNGKELPGSIVNIYIPDNSRNDDNPDQH